MNEADWFQLRWEAFHKVEDAKLIPKTFLDNYTFFANQLGYADWISLAGSRKLELLKKFEMLNGPYWETVWKAILVKNSLLELKSPAYK